MKMPSRRTLNSSDSTPATEDTTIYGNVDNGLVLCVKPSWPDGTHVPSEPFVSSHVAVPVAPSPGHPSPAAQGWRHHVEPAPGAHPPPAASAPAPSLGRPWQNPRVEPPSPDVQPPPSWTPAQPPIHAWGSQAPGRPPTWSALGSSDPHPGGGAAACGSGEGGATTPPTRRQAGTETPSATTPANNPSGGLGHNHGHSAAGSLAQCPPSQWGAGAGADAVAAAGGVSISHGAGAGSSAAAAAAAAAAVEVGPYLILADAATDGLLPQLRPAASPGGGGDALQNTEVGDMFEEGSGELPQHHRVSPPSFAPPGGVEAARHGREGRALQPGPPELATVTPAATAATAAQGHDRTDLAVGRSVPGPAAAAVASGRAVSPPGRPPSPPQEHSQPHLSPHPHPHPHNLHHHRHRQQQQLAAAPAPPDAPQLVALEWHTLGHRHPDFARRGGHPQPPPPLPPSLDLKGLTTAANSPAATSGPVASAATALAATLTMGTLDTTTCSTSTRTSNAASTARLGEGRSTQSSNLSCSRLSGGERRTGPRLHIDMPPHLQPHLNHSHTQARNPNLQRHSASTTTSASNGGGAGADGSNGGLWLVSELDSGLGRLPDEAPWGRLEAGGQRQGQEAEQEQGQMAATAPVASTAMRKGTSNDLSGVALQSGSSRLLLGSPVSRGSVHAVAFAKAAVTAAAVAALNASMNASSSSVNTAAASGAAAGLPRVTSDSGGLEAAALGSGSGGSGGGGTRRVLPIATGRWVMTTREPPRPFSRPESDVAGGPSAAGAAAGATAAGSRAGSPAATPLGSPAASQLRRRGMSDLDSGAAAAAGLIRNNSGSGSGHRSHSRALGSGTEVGAAAVTGDSSVRRGSRSTAPSSTVFADGSVRSGAGVGSPVNLSRALDQPPPSSSSAAVSIRTVSSVSNFTRSNPNSVVTASLGLIGGAAGGSGSSGSLLLGGGGGGGGGSSGKRLQGPALRPSMTSVAASPVRPSAAASSPGGSPRCGPATASAITGTSSTSGALPVASLGCSSTSTSAGPLSFFRSSTGAASASSASSTPVGGGRSANSTASPSSSLQPQALRLISCTLRPADIKRAPGSRSGRVCTPEELSRKLLAEAGGAATKVLLTRAAGGTADLPPPASKSARGFFPPIAEDEAAAAAAAAGEGTQAGGGEGGGGGGSGRPRSAAGAMPATAACGCVVM